MGVLRVDQYAGLHPLVLTEEFQHLEGLRYLVDQVKVRSIEREGEPLLLGEV